MSTLVNVTDLRKSFGKKKALDGISFTMAEGRVLGILGPNGSGKTTLIKILAGIARLSKGEVLIDGEAPGVYTKSIVSYLPDREFLYKNMKIKGAVKLFKDFYGDFDIEKCRRLLAFMKLNENDKIENLSKGMKEKLNLSLVLSRKAKLYILDEPIAGVDPVARDQILDAIIDNVDEKSTMLITTHIVRDMEKLFDDVLFLSDGQITLYGDADTLRTERGMQIDDLYKAVFA